MGRFMWVAAGVMLTAGLAGCGTTVVRSGAQAATVFRVASSTKGSPTTLSLLSGDGDDSTRVFVVSGSWNMRYHYDCGSFGSEGDFRVFALDADGTPDTTDPPTVQFGWRGTSSTFMPAGGTFTLEIDSECAWTVAAIGRP